MSHALLYIAPSITQAGLPAVCLTESVDCRHIIVDAFGIADARTLEMQARSKAVMGGAYTFVVCTIAMTNEAQNALLKLFEDPPPETVFHMVVPHEQMLLPTLRSRFVLMQQVVSENAAADAAFLTWCAQPLAKRIEEVGAQAAKKNTAWFLAIKEGGLQWMRSRYKTLGATTSTQLATSLGQVGARGASNKMLLEHVALLLPVES